MPYFHKIECPHCGREFVDWVHLSAHIGPCAENKQKKLNREFEEINSPQGTAAV